MKRFGCLWALISVVVLSIIGWQVVAYSWYQGLLPHGLSAPIITYRINRADGFGPGGNEAGLIVYRMSEATARLVERQGLTYLESTGRREDHGQYFQWRETPLVPLWSGHGEHTCDRTPGIGAFVDYGDLRCHLSKPEVEAINRILSTHGSYVAQGTGSSVIIVAPRQRKIVIAYNG